MTAIFADKSAPEEPKPEAEAKPEPRKSAGGFPLETRTLNINDQKVEIDFLVVDSPEKWELAEHSSGHYDMPMPGSSRRMRFACKGVSAAQWEEVEVLHPIPQWCEPDVPEPPEFRKGHKILSELKAMRVMEISIGMTFPGKSESERLAWLNQRPDGEREALWNYIHNEVLGFNNGRFTAMLRNHKEELQIEEFKNFDDWAVAEQSKYFLRIHRPLQNYIVEFPIRGISAEQKTALIEECKDPDPPREPWIDPQTKRHVAGKTIANLNHPGWLRQMRAVAQKRTAMMFEMALPFDMPGSTYKDKYNWIVTHLAGDLVHIQRFIVNDVVGYGGRYDFFSRNLDPAS